MQTRVSRSVKLSSSSPGNPAEKHVPASVNSEVGLRRRSSRNLKTPALDNCDLVRSRKRPRLHTNADDTEKRNSKVRVLKNRKLTPLRRYGNALRNNIPNVQEKLYVPSLPDQQFPIMACILRTVIENGVIKQVDCSQYQRPTTKLTLRRTVNGWGVSVNKADLAHSVTLNDPSSATSCSISSSEDLDSSQSSCIGLSKKDFNDRLKLLYLKNEKRKSCSPNKETSEQNSSSSSSYSNTSVHDCHSTADELDKDHDESTKKHDYFLPEPDNLTSDSASLQDVRVSETSAKASLVGNDSLSRNIQSISKSTGVKDQSMIVNSLPISPLIDNQITTERAPKIRLKSVDELCNSHSSPGLFAIKTAPVRHSSPLLCSILDDVHKDKVMKNEIMSCELLRHLLRDPDGMRSEKLSYVKAEVSKRERISSLGSAMLKIADDDNSTKLLDGAASNFVAKEYHQFSADKSSSPKLDQSKLDSIRSFLNDPKEKFPKFLLVPVSRLNYLISQPLTELVYLREFTLVVGKCRKWPAALHGIVIVQLSLARAHKLIYNPDIELGAILTDTSARISRASPINLHLHVPVDIRSSSIDTDEFSIDQNPVQVGEYTKLGGETGIYPTVISYNAPKIAGCIIVSSPNAITKQQSSQSVCIAERHETLPRPVLCHSKVTTSSGGQLICSISDSQLSSGLQSNSENQNSEPNMTRLNGKRCKSHNKVLTSQVAIHPVTSVLKQHSDTVRPRGSPPKLHPLNSLPENGSPNDMNLPVQQCVGIICSQQSNNDPSSVAVASRSNPSSLYHDKLSEKQCSRTDTNKTNVWDTNATQNSKANTMLSGLISDTGRYENSKVSRSEFGREPFENHIQNSVDIFSNTSDTVCTGMGTVSTRRFVSAPSQATTTISSSCGRPLPSTIPPHGTIQVDLDRESALDSSEGRQPSTVSYSTRIVRSVDSNDKAAWKDLTEIDRAVPEPRNTNEIYKKCKTINCLSDSSDDDTGNLVIDESNVKAVTTDNAIKKDAASKTIQIASAVPKSTDIANPKLMSHSAHSEKIRRPRRSGPPGEMIRPRFRIVSAQTSGNGSKCNRPKSSGKPPQTDAHHSCIQTESSGAGKCANVTRSAQKHKALLNCNAHVAVTIGPTVCATTDNDNPGSEFSSSRPSKPARCDGSNRLTSSAIDLELNPSLVQDDSLARSLLHRFQVELEMIDNLVWQRQCEWSALLKLRSSKKQLFYRLRRKLHLLEEFGHSDLSSERRSHGLHQPKQSEQVHKRSTSSFQDQLQLQQDIQRKMRCDSGAVNSVAEKSQLPGSIMPFGVRSESLSSGVAVTESLPCENPKSTKPGVKSKLTTSLDNQLINSAVDQLICGGCGVKRSHFMCSNCQRRWYCSRTCQIFDWTSHSPLCLANSFRA